MLWANEPTIFQYKYNSIFLHNDIHNELVVQESLHNLFFDNIAGTQLVYLPIYKLVTNTETVNIYGSTDYYSIMLFVCEQWVKKSPIKK